MKNSLLLTPALPLWVKFNKAKSLSSALKASRVVGVNVSGTTRRQQTSSGCWLTRGTGEQWVCCLVLRSHLVPGAKRWQCGSVGTWHRACAGRESRSTSTSTYPNLGKQESPWIRAVPCYVDGSQHEGRLDWISRALLPPVFL